MHRYFCLPSAVGLLMGAISQHTMAHEPRIVGPANQISMTIGHLNEPAFEDETNAVDIFLRHHPSGEPISVQDGDSVELKVHAMLLADDDINAKVLRDDPLRGELRQAFDSEDRYNIYFRPTVDGAYGYHIVGHINNIAIDEVFVCGGGSKNPKGSAFGCVEDPQPFPGNRWADWDWRGYFDDDRFSLEE